jgi:hypothetical protein
MNNNDKGGDLQDGMLAYYLSAAKCSDANVEARLEKEPFDYRDMMIRAALQRTELRIARPHNPAP